MSIFFILNNFCSPTASFVANYEKFNRLIKTILGQKKENTENLFMLGILNLHSQFTPKLANMPKNNWILESQNERKLPFWFVRRGEQTFFRFFRKFNTVSYSVLIIKLFRLRKPN